MSFPASRANAVIAPPRFATIGSRDASSWKLFSGVRVAFPVAGTPALRHTGRTQLAQVVTTTSGSVLRWETLDVDLSVAGLLLAIA